MTDVLRDAQQLSPEFSASAKISVPKLDVETTGQLGLRDELMKAGPMGISEARGKGRDELDGCSWLLM